MLFVREKVKREACRRCHILRIFLMMVVAIVIIGILGDDRLNIVGRLSPAMFGWGFVILLAILMLVKFGGKYWSKFGRRDHQNE